MRRTVLGLTTGMIAALLAMAPATAGDDSPETRTGADGSQTYTDPSLTDKATTKVEGLLRKVITKTSTGSTESTIIMTDDNSVIPVDFDAAIAESDVPITAELVDGSRLHAALDGEATSPVQVASAEVASAAAMAVGIEHNAYVAIVSNSGSMDPTGTINNRVQAGLDYWEDEGGALLPSFNRASTIEFAPTGMTPAGLCGLSSGSTAHALWDKAAEEFPDGTFVNPGSHLVVVVSDDCAGAGIGTITVGGSIDSGGQLTLTQDATVFTSTLAHELGHNFGLEHANYCAPSCSSAIEYENRYSVMGLAVINTPEYAPPALDSVYRDQLGITVPGETESITSTQTVTRALSPRGASTGLRGIEIRVGGTSYWVDYRNGSDRDTSTFYDVANGALAGGHRYPYGVTVTRQTGSFSSTALMAQTFTIGSWPAGQTFSIGTVRVKVNSLGSTANVTVSLLPQLTGPRPRIIGTAKVGRKLTARVGAWPPGTKFTYRWYVNYSPIAGATKSTYTISKARKGKYISVRVTGSKDGYAPITKISARTKKVVG